MYQATSSVWVAPGVITLDENASEMTLRAMATMCGYSACSEAMRVSVQRTTRSSADTRRDSKPAGSTASRRSCRPLLRPSAIGHWRETLMPMRLGSRSAISWPSARHCASRSPPDQTEV